MMGGDPYPYGLQESRCFPPKSAISYSKSKLSLGEAKADKVTQDLKSSFYDKRPTMYFILWFCLVLLIQYA